MLVDKTNTRVNKAAEGSAAARRTAAVVATEVFYMLLMFLTNMRLFRHSEICFVYSKTFEFAVNIHSAIGPFLGN